jgi:DNA-binding beta-propeller fold protein YncE
MVALDCRGKTLPEAGNALVAQFNRAAAGTRFTALLDAVPAGLKVWLLEAGMRYRAHRLQDGGWRLEIERGASPAQGAIPGVHHVVAEGDSIWTCERAQRVARLDAHSGRLVAVAAVARAASHLAVDSLRDRLFVADAGANAIVALRASDLRIEQTWEAPGRPQLPIVNAEGIVCVTGGRGSGTLTIARPRGGGYVAQTIPVGRCPHDPLFAADGAHLIVPCAGASELAKVRLADGVVIGRCAVGDGPSHLARQPDGSRIYSANSWDGTVACISAEGEVLASAASGGWAHAIDITPDGRWVFVANFLDDTLAVLDALTMERVVLLQTEPYAHGLDVSPDGHYVIATGFGSEHLRLYDAQTHTEVARIEVGRGSSHTAFVSGTAFAFVGCSVDDRLTCIDLDSRRAVSHTRIH